MPSLQLQSVDSFTSATVQSSEDLFSVEILASPSKLSHYTGYYTWADLVTFLTVLATLLYILANALVVPTRSLLLDYLLAETVVIQRASHLNPKWHIMNDSVQEMVTVGRDTISHRQRLRDSAFWGFKYCSQTGCTWLCCRKAITSPGLYCCCLCRSRNGKKQAPCESLDVVMRARIQLEKEFDLVRFVKRLRQTEGLLYAMTTKG